MKLKEKELNMKIELHKKRIKQLEEELKELNKRVVIMKGVVTEGADLSIVYKLEGSDFKDGKTREATMKVEIIREGSKVTCILKDFYDSSLKGVGVARCCEDDEFDLRKGIYLAETRAKQDFYKSLENKLMEIL